MPRRLRTTDEPETISGCAPAPPESSASKDQLRRWAELIAEGQAPFPEGLSPAEHEQLVALVRFQLRGRLAQLIARALATHIFRSCKPVKEDTSHA